jgi:alpha-glucuronidase
VWTGNREGAILKKLIGILAVLLLLPTTALRAEDGYELWLRYRPLDPQLQADLRPDASAIVVPGRVSASVAGATSELRRAIGGLLSATPPTTETLIDGAIILGTPQNSSIVAGLEWPLAELANDGFMLRAATIDGHAVTVVAANSDIGLVYGAFALIRELQLGHSLRDIDTSSSPKIELRILNHWDNLDGTVERGYAGHSLWDWWRLPDIRDPRYTDYARANASLGINGTVLNNVNSNATSLTAAYIDKTAALADVFRPWGIRVYLSARFSAPMEIGGLATADPLDPAVQVWWREKANEIYAAIPDFGGFLVKANSEGQPGPQDYGRSHAEGANMLASALQAHGGVVMWRAIVYAAENPDDRAKQAYDEFKALDGQFAENVLVQVKNGPIDFQPREPFHPLFGAMPNTPLMMEFQITKEYLGFSTHLAYLGTLYEEVLQTDTYAKGPGSTVASVIDGRLHGYRRTGIAGVSNIGNDRDWTGSPFNQADWYAYGRLAWDPSASARTIAEEWLRMTFSAKPDFLSPALEMMLRSREAVVDYMTPLGLAHLMDTGHHYGPGPWVDDLSRPDWNPVYYHRADDKGIGFDRTASGSNAIAQYAADVSKGFADLGQVPDNLLLWFHHLPWAYRMRSTRTLWEELVAHYDHGVNEVEAMQSSWATLETFVDAERFGKTRDLLAVQRREAQWWRDACLAYFMHVSGLDLPDGARPPARTLEDYQSLEFPYAPGR